MHKRLIVFTFFLINTFIVSAQVIDVKVTYIPGDAMDKSIISYQRGNHLSWTDFQGTPNDNVSAAITSSGIGYHFTLHRTEDSAWFAFTVNCTFSKEKSWVLADKKTDYILRHEQKHFDISYINALLFIEKLRNLSLSVKGYKNEIAVVYRESTKELNKMQNDYDTETKNGQDNIKQDEWNKKIAAKIASLQSSVIEAAR